jgi:hypothetical protein
MYEYAWAPGSPGPGYSSGYYVGILQYNDSIGYFLTTQYTNNPNPSGYFDYYYSGSGWYFSWNPFSFGWHLNYYFLEDKNGNTNGYSGSNYFVFMPQDQQKNKNYYQYEVFWLYNWFQTDNNNMNIFFLMNGNIYNYSLAVEPYNFNGYSAFAIPPMPPTYFLCPLTGECEPLFVQSYINAYNTAFNQPVNRQRALYHYVEFIYGDVNGNFIPGTFGYDEKYSSSNGELFKVNRLVDSIGNYIGIPYLFISTGSGGGSGFMYLNWIIVAYGVPYIISVS